MQILSVNPINRKGNVESDAKGFRLPFPVLTGENSDLVIDYNLTKLPMLMIVGLDGKVLFYDRFATEEEMKEVIDPVLEGSAKK